MDKIAVLSNINIIPVAKLLSSDYDVYETEGYGNELEVMMNKESSLHHFSALSIFLIENLMEIIHHEINEIVACEYIKNWFEIFSGNIEINVNYYISDAYLYGEETALSIQSDFKWRIEYKWNIELFKLAAEHHNIFVFPYSRIIHFLGEDRAFSKKLWYMGKIPHTMDCHIRMADEIRHLMRVSQYVPKKVLVLDLDNTLWGGLAGENDITPIELSDEHLGQVYKNTQRIIKQMKESGVILCISSKNNIDDVECIINNHPHMVLRSDDFVIKKINWEEKSKNICEIAQELNVGLESIVFIDDSVQERQLIKDVLPEVEVPEFPSSIETLPSFMVEVNRHYFSKLKMTMEDRRKTDTYLANKKRNELRQTALSFEDYLKNLNIIVSRVDATSNIDRVLQLVNKTNQFNLTTKRYTIKELQEGLSENKEVYAFKVSDRFGDNGIVAVLIVDKTEKIPVIEEFTMSCRIMGRNIEYGIIDYVENDVMKKGYSSLRALYVPTKKNNPVSQLYDYLNYSLIDDNLQMSETKGKLYQIEIKNKTTRNYFFKFIEKED